MSVKYKWNGDALTAKLRANAIKQVTEGVVYLQGRLKERLTGDRSGRVYRVPGTKRYYVSSAPGEAPASRTGTLRNAIIFRINEAKLEGAVGPRELKTSYPQWLEFGTKKMSARPYMKPTYDAEKDNVIAILRNGWGTL